MPSPRPRVVLLTVLLLFASISVRAQQADPTRVRDVVYGHKMGVALTMDVFKPAKPRGIGILWMVSGGWVSSYEAIDPNVAGMLTKRGYTLFAVVHGSQPKFTIPEIVLDIRRAVRFIRTHAGEYGVDPNRLGISGASSGGHLSLMTGAFGDDGSPTAPDPVDRASSRVQAVACFFPPADFLDYGKEGVDLLKVEILRPFWPAFGVTDATPMEERDRIARAVSPIYGVTTKMPPTLIIHGDADPLVPLQQSQRFMAKLDEVKTAHQLIVRPGKGHGWPGMEQEFSVFADWFDKYLMSTPK